MEYCEERGIPHSRFLAEWTPEDRAKVLAVRLERSVKCQRCGTSDWEWAADAHAYTPIAVRCIGCHLTEVARKDVAAGDMTTQVILVPPEKALALAEAPRVKPPRRRE